MDSRIREIEQWVAEAKLGLSECGQEEYFRKLFLLDAEIRTAIKQSGCVPEAASPQHQAKRVRRFYSPGAAVTGAFGVLLLAATTVLLNRPQAPLAPVMATTGQPAPAAASTYDPRTDPGHIPASIEGEEVLGGSVLLSALLAQSSAPESQLAAGLQPAEHGAGATAPPQQPAGAGRGAASAAAPKYAPPASKAGGPRAPAVEIMASAKPAQPQPRTNAVPASSSSGDAFNGTVSAARFNWFPEVGKADVPVNRAKEKAGNLAKGTSGQEIVVELSSADLVDNSAGAEEDKADKLDPEALKDKLEKRFDR